jgi:hypothetical protein
MARLIQERRASAHGWRWWTSAGLIGAGGLALGYFLNPERRAAHRLHPGPPKPALRARARVLADGGWPPEPGPDVDSEA